MRAREGNNQEFCHPERRRGRRAGPRVKGAAPLRQSGVHTTPAPRRAVFSSAQVMHNDVLSLGGLGPSSG